MTMRALVLQPGGALTMMIPSSVNDCMPGGQSGQSEPTDLGGSRGLEEVGCDLVVHETLSLVEFRAVHEAVAEVVVCSTESALGTACPSSVPGDGGASGEGEAPGLHDVTLRVLGDCAVLHRLTEVLPAVVALERGVGALGFGVNSELLCVGYSEVAERVSLHS
eukprot:16173-Rhodomonas_salina.2